MSRATFKKAINWTLFCVAAAYPVYSWISYTGLWRWGAELDLTLQGSGPYEIHVMILLTCVVLFTAITAGWLSRQLDRWLPLPAPAPVAAAENMAMANAAGVKVEKGIMPALRISCLVAIAVIGALIYFDKSAKTHTFEPMNLADGITPPSRYVKLIGLAVPSMEIRYRYFVHWYSGSDSDGDAYIPVLPPHWHPGDPVVYLLHPLLGNYLKDSQPVTIGQTGILLRDALPGPATFLFKKHGITLGKPPIVLDADPGADEGWQAGVGIGCAVYVLFVALPILILNWWARRRESRRIA